MARTSAHEQVDDTFGVRLMVQAGCCITFGSAYVAAEELCHCGGTQAECTSPEKLAAREIQFVFAERAHLIIHAWSRLICSGSIKQECDITSQDGDGQL